MLVDDLLRALEQIAQNATLYSERNFAARQEALDYLESRVGDGIAALRQAAEPTQALWRLEEAAARLTTELQDVDERLFQGLRADIRRGGCRGQTMIDLVEACAGAPGRGWPDDPAYDNRDAFINGLLLARPAPVETKAREPGMVAYQPTPARLILQLIQQAQPTADDIFYDLGSGLGQVSILVHLLSGAQARGIEFEPALCNYAAGCAADLNLPAVTFCNADARSADFRDGTLFFLFTPFQGKILQDVLDRLQRVSQAHAMSVYTYGPCTAAVARQPWLRPIGRVSAATLNGFTRIS